MKDLYGEEGEVFLDQLEKREKGFQKECQQEMVQIEELGEITQER